MKKARIFIVCISTFIFAAMFVCFSGGQCFAEGSDIAESHQVLLNLFDENGKYFFQTYVKNHKVNYRPAKETTITLSSDEQFCGVYIMLNYPPCEWSIELNDGQRLQGGDFNCLHEYMPLNCETNSVKLTLPEGANVFSIMAFSEGQLPSWVQMWQPPCESADLLVLPTHSDDEFLWFGGTLPYYAGELGYNVQVAYMTNHSNSKWRYHELLNALWTAGVRNYPVFSDFVDITESKKSLSSAEEIFGHNNVLNWQLELIRRFKPKVIVGHDIEGEYGHGAHKLNSVTLLEALKLSDNSSVHLQSVYRYGTYKVQKCYLHLWPENQIEIEWSNIPLSKFDGKTADDIAKKAYECNLSQLKFYNYSQNSVLYDNRIFGLAYTSVGNDTPGKNDMFENVDWGKPAEARESDDAAVKVSSSDTQIGNQQVNNSELLNKIMSIIGTIGIVCLLAAAAIVNAIKVIRRKLKAKIK